MHPNQLLIITLENAPVAPCQLADVLAADQPSWVRQTAPLPG